MRTLLTTAAILLFTACAQPGAAGEEPPNASNQRPAFENQTRAPRVSSNVEIEVQTLAEGLWRPWAIAFLPSGDALVTERNGHLRIISAAGVLDPAEVAGVPYMPVTNQGGLLDVAVSPNFATDRTIFLSYAETRDHDENGTSVARARLSADHKRLENFQVIFRQQPSWESQYHFGSRLVFDREGHLFVTLGERSEAREHAQDLSDTLGKVVRINTDGSAPSDNPFVGRAGAAPEIWSYGHRNMQGADLHPETGQLWTIEHGPQGGDELNAPRAGRNYGWPIISYGEEYGGDPIGAGITQQEGMEQPIYYWDPVIGPGDIDFYRGELFPWRGDLLIAGLRSQALVRLELQGERVVGEERFQLEIGRVRDVTEAPDGSLWVATDEEEGRIVRLTPRTAN
jgi:glucose/arabinose dehydrogenase